MLIRDRAGQDTGEGVVALDVQFYRLSDELQPYFTALYSFTLECPDDVVLRDMLHPEWSMLRFTASGTPPLGGVIPEPVRPSFPCVASGPTSRAIAFGLKRSRIWGLGLQPAGWARYVAVEAHELADRIVDASAHPAFALLTPIMEEVCDENADPDTIARRIDDHLRRCAFRASSAEEKIRLCQDALRDPEISDVAMLADAVGVGRRTLERLCSRYFGFPPKLLLRRQRFLRSLAKFMLETHQSWSKSLDGQYYDQAHFVRDFRRFMGTTPSEYAQAEHPILDRIIAQRMADQGAAPQTDLPTVMRYIDDPHEGG